MSRVVAIGIRGAIHVAHPRGERALCGAAVREITVRDAYGEGIIEVYNGCSACCALTYSGGNEARQIGAYA